MRYLKQMMKKCRALMQRVNVFAKFEQMNMDNEMLTEAVVAWRQEIESMGSTLRDVESQSQESADTLDTHDLDDLMTEDNVGNMIGRALEDSELVCEDRANEIAQEVMDDCDFVAADRVTNMIECSVDEKIEGALQDHGDAIDYNEVASKVAAILSGRMSGHAINECVKALKVIELSHHEVLQDVDPKGLKQVRAAIKTAAAVL